MKNITCKILWKEKNKVNLSKNRVFNKDKFKNNLPLVD